MFILWELFVNYKDNGSYGDYEMRIPDALDNRKKSLEYTLNIIGDHIQHAVEVGDNHTNVYVPKSLTDEIVNYLQDKQYKVIERESNPQNLLSLSWP